MTRFAFAGLFVRLALLFTSSLGVHAAEPLALLPATAVVAEPWPPPLEAVSWAAADAPPGKRIAIKVLGFNDFHGMLLPGTPHGGRPAGGAAALGAYLAAAAQGMTARTLIVHAGDHVGASPPMTLLLDNEPAIDFLNQLANRHCRYGSATVFRPASHWRKRANHCNVVGTLGNHEFDAGLAELRRLLDGGNAARGPYLRDPWRGSRVPYVSANVLERRSGELVLPAYTVVVLDGMPVGVIGATLRDASSIMSAERAAELRFLDEAESINAAAAELKAQGIHTLIVTIHQGLEPVVAAGVAGWRGPLLDIVARLDEDIDVVVAGHKHSFTNGLFPNRAGKPVLVTQSYMYGTAFDEIDLTIDVRTRDVVAKAARVQPTWSDAGPALHPDPRTVRLTQEAQRFVAARVGRVVGSSSTVVVRVPTAGGETPMGNLVTDAMRAATGADMAITNTGAAHADLPAGPITWANVLTALPYQNQLVTADLTGAQVLGVLEGQWRIPSGSALQILKTSGLNYVWDASRPLGSRVVRACDATGKPLDLARSYRVTSNSYLASGGDDLPYFRDYPFVDFSTKLDSDAVASFLDSLGGPLQPTVEGRIVRRDVPPAATDAVQPASLCQLP